MLQELLDGTSIKAAAEKLRLPFALESIYHLLSRLRLRLDVLRSALCRRQKAPESRQSDSLLQTVEHLNRVFAGTACPVADFQVVFEQPWMG
jgi:hypothetical protein